MIMTVLEAHVPPDRASTLLEAYAAAGDTPLPPGLVRTELLLGFGLKAAAVWLLFTGDTRDWFDGSAPT